MEKTEEKGAKIIICKYCKNKEQRIDKDEEHFVCNKCGSFQGVEWWKPTGEYDGIWIKHN